MNQIILIDKDTCEILSINGYLEFHPFLFKENKNSVSVFYDSKEYSIRNNQSIKIDDWILMYEKDNNAWYLFYVQDLCHIGRNHESDIVLDNSYTSYNHCTIYKEKECFWIQDEKSTNGTYVNKKRIEKVQLKSSDQIVIGNVQLYFVSNYVVLNKKIEGCICEITNRIQPSIPIDSYRPSVYIPIEKVSIEVESPNIIMDSKPPSIFSTIGSSLMIFLSSFLTTIIMITFLDSSMESVSTTFFSSSSMCIAFLLYGILNRYLILKSNRKEKIQSENLYIEYLNDISQRVLSLQDEYLKINNQNISIFTDCDLNNIFYFLDKPYQVLISLKEFRWCDFTYQKAGYQNKYQSLFKQRDELLNMECTTMRIPEFMNQYEKVWIQTTPSKKYLDFLMNQYCFLCHREDRKVVIVADISYEHPCCYQDRVHLLARTKEDISRIKSILNTQYEYLFIVLDKDLLAYCLYEPSSLIFISKEIVNYSFDKIIKNPFYTSMDSSCIRTSSLMYSLKLSKKKKFIDSKNFKLDWNHKQANLNVHIGIDSSNEYVDANFKEGLDGPHALIAGMTGSGKSELLSTILMGLIVLNPPSLLQYILIDFKGESFARAFYEFDHCAGLVSNLDSQSMRRFVSSMRSEISKRQSRLKEMIQEHPEKTAHIDTYNECHPSCLMSHLFVIVDEFAQLKSQFPQDLDSLVEMARIGRSLGIHLILSTQKPMGIISEQIWSNTTLKICLKVNSEMDSREVLHNSKAAYLNHIGEFVLQSSHDSKEKIGTSFYLKEKIETNLGYSIVNSDNQIIDSIGMDESMTILQFIHDIFQKNKQGHHWILLPDLDSQRNFDDGLIRVDMPEIQKQISIDSFNKMIVLTNDVDDIVSRILSFYTSSVYLCEIYGYEDYCDESFSIDTLLMNADCFCEEDLLVVKTNDLTILSNLSCRMIVLVDLCTSQIMDSIHTFEYRISYHASNLDSIRYFLDDYSITKQDCDKIQISKKIYNYILCQKNLFTKKNKKMILKNYSQNILGKCKESKEILSWNQKNPLVFCYVQKSALKQIEFILSKWSDISVSNGLDLDCDVSVVYMPCVDIELFNQNQFDVDIVWVGLGFIEYSYLIKRKHPMDLNSTCIYFSQSEVYTFDFYE